MTLPPNPSSILILSALIFASHVNAANIIWQAPAASVGDADVRTTGALDRAFNFTSGSVGNATVNGVTFNEFAVPKNTVTSVTIGNTTVTELGAVNLEADSSAFGSVANPFAGLTAGHRLLLQSSVYTQGNSHVLALTLNALTIGQDYLFESWVNDSRGGPNVIRSESVTGGSGVSAPMAYNPTQSEGSAGQYLVGNFTADATSQVISFQALGGNPSTQINAFQLRLVPEPASAVLLLGGAALLGLRRRR